MKASESKLDSSFVKCLNDFAQRMSRRGVIARVGKFVLAAMGISLMPNLPWDRSFTAAAKIGCGDWKLCGICGNLCTSCCGGGGLFNCPSCTTKGHFWAKCCT